MANLKRKSESAAVMFDNLVKEMNHAVSIDRRNDFTNPQVIPSWL